MSALPWAQVDYAPTRGELEREAWEAGDWPGAHTCRRCSRVIYEAEDGWMDTSTECCDEFVCDDGDPHDPTEGPTMTVTHLGIVAGHTDVVCPPDPHAVCKHCGDELAEHQPSDPDSAPAPGEATCRDDIPAAWLANRAPQQFVLADGGSLDCPDATSCNLCDAEICTEHSSEFVTCVDGGVHHGDCQAQCVPCAQDIAAEQRDETRRGR